MNKTLGVILVGIVGAGGTYALTTEQINQMQQKMNKIQQEKHLILKDYIYSQISSDRIPIIDISIVSADDVSQAYIEVVGTTDISEPNLFIAGKNLAKQKNDYVCAK